MKDSLREIYSILKFCWVYKWRILKFRLSADHCDDCGPGYCPMHIDWMNDIVMEYDR